MAGDDNSLRSVAGMPRRQVLVCILVAPLLIRLPANTPGKAAEDSSSAWLSAPLWENWKKGRVEEEEEGKRGEERKRGREARCPFLCLSRLPLSTYTLCWILTGHACSWDPEFQFC